MTAQHRLLPGNEWDVRVSDLIRQVEEDRNRPRDRRATASGGRRAGKAAAATGNLPGSDLPLSDPILPRVLRMVARGEVGATTADPVTMRHRTESLSARQVRALAVLHRDGYLTLERAESRPTTAWCAAALTDRGATLLASRTQPRPWAIPPELGRWLALRRLRRGRVAVVAPASFSDGGRRLPDYLVHHLCELIDEGYARIDARQVRTARSGNTLFVALEPSRRPHTSGYENGPQGTDRCDPGTGHDPTR